MTPNRRFFYVIAGLAGCTLASCNGAAPSDITARPDRTGLSETTDDTRQIVSGESLALTCSGCHGSESGGVPSYDGLSENTLEALLLDYKSDINGTTVMHRLMRGYDEAQIVALSLYLSDSEAPQLR